MTTKKLTHAERAADGWTQRIGVYDDSTETWMVQWTERSKDGKATWASWGAAIRYCRRHGTGERRPRMFWWRKKPKPAAEKPAPVFELGQWVVLRGAPKLVPFKIAFISGDAAGAEVVGNPDGIIHRWVGPIAELMSMPPGAVPLQVGDIVEDANGTSRPKGTRGKVTQVEDDSFPISVEWATGGGNVMRSCELRLIRRDEPKKSGTVSVELGQSAKIANTPPVSPMRVAGLEATGGFRVGDTVRFKGNLLAETFSVGTMDGSWPGPGDGRFYPPSECVLISRPATEPFKVGDRVQVTQEWIVYSSSKDEGVRIGIPGQDKWPAQYVSVDARHAGWIRKLP